MSLALRAIVGAAFGLGAVDLAWIDLSLAPSVVASASEPEFASALASEAPLQVNAIAPAAVALVPAPTAPTAREAPRVAVAPLAQVYFPTLGSALDPSSRRQLQRAIAGLGPDVTIIVDGHADYRGPEALNRTLSKDRALAVVGYLNALGMPRARIRLAYDGAAVPTVATALWHDRRVDVEIAGGSR